MSMVLAQALLGIYAVLLAAGGFLGYRRAGSRPSLIAGVGSAVVALLALGVTFVSPAGFGIGAVLAAALTVMFGVRFSRGRKFMPAGLLTLISVAVLAGMIARLIGVPA